MSIAAARFSRGDPKLTPPTVTGVLDHFVDHSIDVPALIIQGDADRILPFPVTGKRLHEAIKGSQLVVLEGGPHGIPWTHAEEINRALLAFLK